MDGTAVLYAGPVGRLVGRQVANPETVRTSSGSTHRQARLVFRQRGGAGAGRGDPNADSDG